MVTYENYLQSPEPITFEEMQKLHKMIVSDVGTDPNALELYHMLIEKATEYANIRAKWPLLPKNEKIDQDSRRTSCHDSLLIKFKMLARYLKKQNKKAFWLDALESGTDNPYSRKRIGDFACYLIFVNSLISR